MKLKDFHEASELGDPVVLEPKELGTEQRLTQVYLAERATKHYQTKLRWNSTEGIWHCYDYETGMWERTKSETIITLLMLTLNEMRSVEPVRGCAGKFYRRIRMKGESVNEDFFKTPTSHRFGKV